MRDNLNLIIERAVVAEVCAQQVGQHGGSNMIQIHPRKEPLGYKNAWRPQALARGVFEARCLDDI